MTDREIMQMVLDALEHGLPIIEDFGGKEQLQIQHKAISALYEALRAALAQPEQEPVAWIKKDRSSIEVSIMSAEYMMEEGFDPLYTAPPQREWQGLTDEEVRRIVQGNTDAWCDTPETDGYGVAEMVEAKLKEKNA